MEIKRDTQYQKGMEYLVEVVQSLSLARTLDDVVDIVRQAARNLTGADGATFILRESDLCYYVDEDAIGPLWKGKRFPIESCVSGWSMLNKQAAVIEDIYEDERIPKDAYRPTFVKSLVMVPIRKENPLGAIGNYWQKNRKFIQNELHLLEALAAATSTALENVKLLHDLQKSKQELERQLLLRDEFISVVAHELKTPVTPLSMQVQFLQKLLVANEFSSHPREKEIERLVEVSLRKVHELTKFIDNLLDVSRVRFGQFPFHLKDQVNLLEVVERSLKACSPLSSSKIEMDISADISGHWDAARLEQLFINLVSNAVKYGENKSIQIIAKYANANVVIEVKDQGMGIDEEDRLRIFERFERAVSMRSFGGLGLGLFIAKQIVDGHKGKLAVMSEKGKGSTFIVELPVRSF